MTNVSFLRSKNTIIWNKEIHDCTGRKKKPRYYLRSIDSLSNNKTPFSKKKIRIHYMNLIFHLLLHACDCKISYLQYIHVQSTTLFTLYFHILCALPVSALIYTELLLYLLWKYECVSECCLCKNINRKLKNA